ncbi:hypothetical protein K7G82_13310 [Sphingomonas colocasiae]|uniref:Porin family protein n=2 Tax=Sphingomonas colocasiae TaxID=1848973 RepID=A0ABS7PPX7_9SPHN|nr:hypothetical protein [Sphingomonas colocasiae]
MGGAEAAQAKGVVAELNGARASGVWGGEIGMGYEVSAGGFALRPMAGMLVYKGDNDRYYRDDLANGQSRCRDSTNGQFASDSRCMNVAARVYARLEATYNISGVGEVGGGARYSGGKVRGYGTIGKPIGPVLSLKANVGDRYYALGLRAGF